MPGEGKLYKPIENILNFDMQSKKTKYYKIIFAALTIAWMGLIFFMSSRNAEESTNDSNFVIILIGRIFHSDFESWDKLRVEEYLSSLSLLIRKTAHASEYAILCFLSSHMLLAGTEKKLIVRLKRIAIGFLISVFYSITDEFHQSFVPGRACTITDVMIDSLGAFVMVLLLTIVLVIIVKKDKR